MFTACSACTFLKNLMDKTPRSQPEILAAIRKRLGAGNPCYLPIVQTFHDVSLLSCQLSFCRLHMFPGQHYAFQASQRLAIARCQEMCKRTGDDWWVAQKPIPSTVYFWVSNLPVVIALVLRYLSIDKCDQNKTILPCVHDMLLSCTYGTNSQFNVLCLHCHKPMPYRQTQDVDSLNETRRAVCCWSGRGAFCWPQAPLV